MKERAPDYKRLAISAAGSLILLLIAMSVLNPISPDTMIHRLLFPMVRLMGFITIGLAAGQVIEAMGWTRKVAILARPVFTFSRMGDHCSAAFTTAFLSGAAANAMLLEFYEEKKITKRQLFLSNFINQFPAYFLHLPTTVFIVLPLTGIAGALYFIITFLATLFRTLCFLLFSRLVHPAQIHVEPDSDGPELSVSRPRPGISQILKTIQKRLPARIITIFVWVLPIYCLVFILNTNGFFTYLNQALSRFVAIKLIPVESLSVVILSFAAEFTSGFAAAGALMDAGVLSVKQTVLALLFGNVIAFPIRALRHQLPRYMGIFSPKMGLQLLLSGQVFRVVSIIFIGTLYYLVV